LCFRFLFLVLAVVNVL